MNEQVPEPVPEYDRNAFGWFMFDWHSPGQKDIAADRGISRVEAATVYADPLSITIYDPQAAAGAARFVTAGRSYRGRRLRVLHTDTVESGAPKDRPDTLWVRIDDAQEMVPGADDAGAQSDCGQYARGASGRYAALYEAGTNVAYIDENERYWFNIPADLYQSCLWGIRLEGVRSGTEQPIVDLTFDITHIRLHHRLPDNLRFILRLEGVTSVRAYHTLAFPSGQGRDETISWHEFEAAVNSAGMYVEDTRLARDEDAHAGLFLDMDGLLEGEDQTGRGTADVTFRIHAGAVRVLRSDGMPCSLEELARLGDAEWDAREERAQAGKRPLVARLQARFRSDRTP